MTETTVPYVERAPGDLLTAEDWNTVQVKIHADIRSTSQAAADAVTHVASADDADHLEGKDLDALTAEVTKRVLDEVRGRSGYQQLVKVLRAGEITVLEHGLGTAPVVDLYKLEYFEVVCREDDETRAAFATFYLHHSEERRVRVTADDGTRRSIDIQPPDFPDLGIPFADMLARYQVEYTDTTTLDDLETEFWKAFYRDPNDQFGDDQYCHSPWFERCCKEQQTVRRLKQNGDWNDIVFQMRPRKSVNFAGTPAQGDNERGRNPRPANTFVQHLDNNRTAVWFEGTALHDAGLESRARDYIGAREFDSELKLMILLKA
ncbi:hypothetical protein [Pengzhenrongella sicca]|uniref:Uncharacterized protein n=1 Tax=Pengzhenrongella sicca TaxID=2819238 RepID=A0A8A4Z796_9MICO|nr:hypothetical protein [Pengzhenrongella sicca]QTE27770.1 hypothetical protein J4E96_10000 [Pengzhenrongella sicca]